MDALKYLWNTPAVRRAAVSLATAVIGVAVVYLGDMSGPAAALAVAALGGLNAWLSNFIPKDA